jgi:hypothetical protein
MCEVGDRAPDHALRLQRAGEDDARRRLRDDDHVGRSPGLGPADDVAALHACLVGLDADATTAAP